MTMTYSKFLTSSALAAGLLGAALSAQAVTHDVINWGPSTTGTYVDWSIASSADGDDVLYTFTQTGDMDGLGSIDDTLSIVLRHEGFTGSSFDGTDVTLGTSFNLNIAALGDNFGPDGDIDNNQSFQVSIDSVSFVQGESLGWVATFDGFSQILSTTSLGVVNYMGTVGAQTITGITGNQQLNLADLEVLTLTATSNNNRFRSLDFSVTTAVPEPATYALLGGLLALGFVMVRRRS